MSWITLTREDFIATSVSVFAIYLILMIFIKLNGLRSFAKMSSHDFAVTIAIGSIIASVALNQSSSIAQGALAIGVFLLLQSLFSAWRFVRKGVYLENEPLLLMNGSIILDSNLKKAKITEADLIAKLREANVLDFKDVKAVVFESSGDISVIHGSGRFDDYLLKHVTR